MVVNTHRVSSRCPLALLLRSPGTRAGGLQHLGIQVEATPVILAGNILARVNQAVLRASIQDRASPVTHQANILALVNLATLVVSIQDKDNLSPAIPAADILHQGSRVTLIHRGASILVREGRAILPVNIQVQVRVTLEVNTQVVATPEVVTLVEEATLVVVIRVHTRVVTHQPCTTPTYLKSQEAF